MEGTRRGTHHIFARLLVIEVSQGLFTKYMDPTSDAKTFQMVGIERDCERGLIHNDFKSLISASGSALHRYRTQ